MPNICQINHNFANFSLLLQWPLFFFTFSSFSLLYLLRFNQSGGRGMKTPSLPPPPLHTPVVGSAPPKTGILPFCPLVWHIEEKGPVWLPASVLNSPFFGFFQQFDWLLIGVCVMPGLIDKGGGKEYRRGSEGLGARYVQTWLGWPTKWLAGSYIY